MKNRQNRVSKSDKKSAKNAKSGETCAPGAAARLLGVSKPTLKKMVQRGDLQGFHMPSGTLRVFVDSIEEFKNERATKGRSARNPSHAPRNSNRSSSLDSQREELESTRLRTQKIRADKELADAKDEATEAAELRRAKEDRRKEEARLKRIQMEGRPITEAEEEEAMDREAQAIIDRYQRENAQIDAYQAEVFRSKWRPQIPTLVWNLTGYARLSEEQTSQLIQAAEAELDKHPREDEPKIEAILIQTIRRATAPMLAARKRQQARQQIEEAELRTIPSATDSQILTARKAIRNKFDGLSLDADDLQLRTAAREAAAPIRTEAEAQAANERTLGWADLELLSRGADEQDRAALRGRCIPILSDLPAETPEAERRDVIRPLVVQKCQEIADRQATKRTEQLIEACAREALRSLPSDANDHEKSEAQRAIRKAIPGLPKNPKEFEIRDIIECAVKPIREAAEGRLRKGPLLAWAMAEIPDGATEQQTGSIRRSCQEILVAYPDTTPESQLKQELQAVINEARPAIERTIKEKRQKAQKQNHILSAPTYIAHRLSELRDEGAISQQEFLDLSFDPELRRAIQSTLESDLSGDEGPVEVQDIVNEAIDSELPTEEE